MERTGTANLPLHYGRTPPWLFKRMKRLAKEITKVIIYEYGEEEFLKRISNPFFFQSLGCVLAFDWHSSGLTTTVCGALKEALNKSDFGIKMAGGKGKVSRKTPEEIEKIGSDFSLKTKTIEDLKYASKISAKVDNSLVQDGYHLYHHVIIFTERGKWSVIQQGMDNESGYARRYHWISGIKDFVEEPHTGICAQSRKNEVLNLTSSLSRETRKVSLDLARENPIRLQKYIFPGQSTLKIFTGQEKILTMPKEHDIKIGPQIMRSLTNAYEFQPRNYKELISLRGVGPKTIRALALISELVYGTESDWKDPAKFSYAHGGKDGIPYPVEKETIDESTQILKDSINNAEIGKKEKYQAIKRLKNFIQ